MSGFWASCHDVGLQIRDFVFDVVEDPVDQSGRTVGSNDLGALGGCSACLPHWVRDRKLLYVVKGEIEVRVMIPRTAFVLVSGDLVFTRLELSFARRNAFF